ncbi:hypothetical protein J19TS2_00300 [Cohnella xylanilytica]|nr:hypothetical protein J19TS2_00300 [Cohnella xylanilytica]
MPTGSKAAPHRSRNGGGTDEAAGRLGVGFMGSETRSWGSRKSREAARGIDFFGKIEGEWNEIGSAAGAGGSEGHG